MSKDILTVLIILILGGLAWAVSSYLHESKTDQLPPNIESYLNQVDGTLDFSDLKTDNLTR